MADVIVSLVLEKLLSALVQLVDKEVTLVVGVEEELKSLEHKFKLIRAVLDDAEMRQVKEATVRLWLEELKDASYDVEDLLDEWNTAIFTPTIERKEANKGENVAVMKKVCSFFPSSCFCFNQVVLRHGTALNIEKLNKRLDVIANEREKYKFIEGRKTVELEREITASVIDVSEVHGRVQDKNRLVTMLLSESSQDQTNLHILSIVGMGGLGKTTLAQLVYNNDEVKAHFQMKAWVCVSDPFDKIKVARAILEAFTHAAPNVVEFEALLQRIRESIMGKKFFLVLDDVWTEDVKKFEQLIETLKYGSMGSRILVTTRKDTVAKMIGTTNPFQLGNLSEEECWSLFSQVAFFGRTNEERENLEDLGRQIAGKCRGLPLALKTLGSLMRFKERREEWENVLHSGIWELEGVEEGLFPPLLLSYYDLPSTVRRCFSYCAIFPKDHGIDKNELIQMWMAQGYLSSNRNIEMEEVGENYFKILTTRSFFQDFKKSFDGDIMFCKLHDIVHDFAQFLTKGECILVECDGAKESKLNYSHVKARHLKIELQNNASIPVSIDNAKKLRSILVNFDRNGSMIDGALSNLFDQLTYVRTLKLSADYITNSIEELPEDVGKLIHLRYIDLSHNYKLKKLPESMCNSCNLQTLKINSCYELERLPHGMGKLINLRHLENYGISRVSFMPKGMERLTSLRTLREFVVRGDGDDSEAMILEDLEHFNNIRGDLEIRGLGNVTAVQEVKKALLLNKKHIRQLCLQFDGGRGEGDTHEALLEALQLPPNLETLEIGYYKGATMFPNWLMSLTKLSILALEKFNELEHLPPLGKLPSLQDLSILFMYKVKKVGVGFLGIETDCITSSSFSSVIAFPKLKTFYFRLMRNWEEWDYGGMTIEEEKEDSNTTSSGSRTIITIMPQLRSLRVGACEKLKALPDHLLKTAPLEDLKIFECPILAKRYQKSSGEDWHKISHIPNIQIGRNYVQRGGH